MTDKEIIRLRAEINVRRERLIKLYEKRPNWIEVVLMKNCWGFTPHDAVRAALKAEGFERGEFIDRTHPALVTAVKTLQSPPTGEHLESRWVVERVNNNKVWRVVEDAEYGSEYVVYEDYKIYPFHGDEFAWYRLLIN